MGSIIKKRKGKNVYYYFVRSERVDGKPRIVKQSYLGTAETIARMVKSQSAPSPIKSLTIQLGLPASLWFETKRCGVLDALLKLWPSPDAALPSPTISCWQPYTASAIQAPKQRWNAGTTEAF